jgi:hypothetical protein
VLFRSQSEKEKSADETPAQNRSFSLFLCGHGQIVLSLRINTHYIDESTHDFIGSLEMKIRKPDKKVI